MINPLCMDGKTIIVTGASAGIGKATALLLNALGAKVIIVARNIDKLQETASAMQSDNYDIWAMDVNDIDLLQQNMALLVEKKEKLDGFVHCAGMQTTVPLQLLENDTIDAVINTNLKTAIFLAKYFRQKTIVQNGASIVFISSVMALFGQSGLSLYSATKGALISLTKSLAIELSRQNIRVNCIIPGMIDTEMTKNAFIKMPEHQRENWQAAHLLGIGKPVDVANMAAFLMGDTSKWITGSSFVVDGGFTAFKVNELL